jgi:hypothetical protein
VRRSPITWAIVLGLLVGAAGVAIIAATGDPERRPVHVIAEPVAPPSSVARLADALGVDGAVQEDAGGWVVREGNRLVRVQRAPALPWFLAVLDGSCKLVPGAPERGEVLPTLPPSGPTDCPETPGGRTSSSAARPPNMPTADQAVATATEAMRRAGLVPSTATVTDLGNAWRVEGAALAEGRRAPALAWSVTVGPDAVVLAANGFLAGPG